MKFVVVPQPVYETLEKQMRKRIDQQGQLCLPAYCKLPRDCDSAVDQILAGYVLQIDDTIIMPYHAEVMNRVSHCFKIDYYELLKIA